MLCYHLWVARGGGSAAWAVRVYHVRCTCLTALLRHQHKQYLYHSLWRTLDWALNVELVMRHLTSFHMLCWGKISRPCLKQKASHGKWCQSDISQHMFCMVLRDLVSLGDPWSVITLPGRAVLKIKWEYLMYTAPSPFCLGDTNVSGK